MAEWGIQKGITKKIINARVETVKDKPLFKDIFSPTLPLTRNKCVLSDV